MGRVALLNGGAPPVLRQIEVMARVHTEAAIKTIVSICNDPDAPAAARVSAATVILDRGWGRAKQEVVDEVSHESKQFIEDSRKSADEYLTQLLKSKGIF
jgi:hypothetical protein